MFFSKNCKEVGLQNSVGSYWDESTLTPDLGDAICLCNSCGHFFVCTDPIACISACGSWTFLSEIWLLHSQNQSSEY